MEVLSGFIGLCILTYWYLTLPKYMKPTVNSSYFLGKIMEQSFVVRKITSVEISVNRERGG